MVYVLCVGIMCVSALIGKKIAKIVVLRDEFYKLIVVFCDYLKTNISMYRMKTNELIDGFVKNYPSQFDKIFIGFKKCIGAVNNELQLTEIGFLKTSEIQEIKNFLLQLGTSDEANQIAAIENFKQVISYRTELCKKSRNIKEGLIFKISLAIGSVICILII